jgi:hypothetical protein
MKTVKMFQGLTLMIKERPDEFVWATFEEIPGYIQQGYVIVNEIKKLTWEKKFANLHLTNRN